MRLEYVGAIDSTNDELKRRLMSGVLPEDQTVLSADTQTGGRGRAGHVWASPPGVSVSTSMVFYPKQLPPEALSGMTILAAEAVAEAIEELYALPARIKWVNDVLLSEKKVSGILTERVVLPDRKGADDKPREAIVVGIGINAHPGSYPPELVDAATSIDEELQKQPDRQEERVCRRELVEAVWKRFISLLEQFYTCSDVSFIMPAYNARLINAGRGVVVSDGAVSYTATALRADERGRLLVKKEDGSLVTVDSGEVHIRGIYGYV